METTLKKCVGIDCSQNEHVVRFGQLFQDLSIRVSAAVSFSNDLKGFTQLKNWLLKQGSTDSISCVMEATGTYHERLAYYLHEQGFTVHIVLPFKIHNFSKTLPVKTVTDKSAADALTRYGLNNKLKPWQIPEAKYMELRSLLRERQDVIDQKTAASNQLHAVEAGKVVNLSVVARIKARIHLFKQQIKEIEKQVNQMINQDAELKQDIRYITSIPGVAMLTAATIIAETQGFHLITSIKQLISYAGLDVVEKQSGTSVRGKSRISKRGNKNLRKCLYWPAYTAIKRNEKMKQHYGRLIGKTGLSLYAAVSIQRKILVLAYTLWKNKEAFNPESGRHKKSGHPLLNALKVLDSKPAV